MSGDEPELTNDDRDREWLDFKSAVLADALDDFASMLELDPVQARQLRDLIYTTALVSFRGGWCAYRTLATLHRLQKRLPAEGSP